MNACEECHQGQDDPQYSYHEAWCSKAPQLILEPSHPMSADQRAEMITKVQQVIPDKPFEGALYDSDNRTWIGTPPEDMDLDERLRSVIVSTLPDLDPGGVEDLVAALSEAGFDDRWEWD